MLHFSDRLIFHYLLQLIFKLTPLTSAKSFSNYYDVLARNTFRNHCEGDGERFGRCAMRFPLICHAPIFVIGVPEGAHAVNSARSIELGLIYVT